MNKILVIVIFFISCKTSAQENLSDFSASSLSDSILEAKVITGNIEEAANSGRKLRPISRTNRQQDY